MMFGTHHYSALSNGNEEEKQPQKVKARTGLKAYTVLFGISFALGVLGYFSADIAISRISEPIHPINNKLELQIISHTFRYNRSFSEAPSDHTNSAWRGIFPQEGGFFVHPTIAPTRSTFSVFHQLHCLDNIRKSYWENHRAAVRGHKLIDEDVHVDIQPSHVRHCIDLIRQSLMCHGDTTLEVVDEAINGVHGFRTEHQCIDWDELKEWTSEQQKLQHVDQIV